MMTDLLWNNRANDRLRIAVTDLRCSIREPDGTVMTKADFGHELGRCEKSVERYESAQGPSGRILISLAALAAANGRNDLERLFIRAHQDWLAVAAFSRAIQAGRIASPRFSVAHSYENTLLADSTPAASDKWMFQSQTDSR
jgi:hypothetical protein